MKAGYYGGKRFFYAMTVNDKTTSSNMSLKLRARLRMIGVVVLLLGISSACIVYWIGTRSADLADDPLLAGYSKAESRQIEILIGKMGLLMVNFMDALKRPETQAFIIAGISTLIAFGCFYFARLLDNEQD
jgi:hypothetical protein